MHTVNKNTIIRLLGLLALFAGCFASCDGLFENGVSPTRRVELFEAELNVASRDTLYLHFHPSHTELYDSIKAASYFESGTLAPENGEFIVSLAGSPADAADGRKLGSGTVENGVGTVFDMLITFLQDGDDWFIEELLLHDNGSDLDVIDIKVLMEL